MKADEFAERLRNNQPSAQELIENGWPAEMVDEVRARYQCPLRTHRVGIDSADPLLDLIDRYDVSNVEIGFVRFEALPKSVQVEAHGECLIVAAVDADFLVSVRESGEVLSLDGCNFPYVMGSVARNGGRFLHALIELIEGTRRADNPAEVAKRCAEISGSVESMGFYEMLAG